MKHYKLGFAVGSPDSFSIGFFKSAGEDEYGQFIMWEFGILLFSVSLYKYLNDISL